MRRRTSSDLAELRANPNLFTWGQIIEIMAIGEYTIAAYHPWKTNGCSVLTGTVDHDVTNYHTWLHGRSTSHSYPTLDAALVGLIAMKHEGYNGHAAMYFIRMIGADTSA